MLFASSALPEKLWPLARALHSLARERATPSATKLQAAKPPAAKPAKQRKQAMRRRLSSPSKPGRYDHLHGADFSALQGNADTIEDAPMTNAEAASIARRILANAARGRSL